MSQPESFQNPPGLPCAMAKWKKMKSKTGVWGVCIGFGITIIYINTMDEYLSVIVSMVN